MPFQVEAVVPDHDDDALVLWRGEENASITLADDSTEDGCGWEADAEYGDLWLGQVQDSMILPTDSAARKAMPLTTGVLDYFPLALAGVARVSKKGNDKHNPGLPLQWSRDKSTDHADCIPRHLVDRDAIDPDSGEYHYLCMAWRALAYAEIMEEKRLGLGPSRASK